MSSHSILSGSPLFHELSKEELADVLPLMEMETFKPKEEIITEGHSNQFLWVIINGTCEVVKGNGHGEQTRLAVLEKGAIFGEVSFFRPAPHSASIRSMTEVETLMLWKDDFDRLIKSRPNAGYQIAANIANVLAERLTKMDEWTCEKIEGNNGVVKKDEWQSFRAKLYTDWNY